MANKAPTGIYPHAESRFASGACTNKHFKATGEFRPPKAGEWYLSGAIVEAWCAPNDLKTAYWIAKQVRLATCPLCNGSGRIAVERGAPKNAR